MRSSEDSNNRIALTADKRYFTYRGKPIWLSGHSRMWTLTGVMSPGALGPGDSLADEPYMRDIEALASCGAHLMRVTPYWPGNWKDGKPMPWHADEPGCFDLTRFNDDYWRRFRHFVSECASRDIAVHMEIWDRPGLSCWNETRWPAHPLNPDNNVNYGTDVIGGGDSDVVGGERPFYRTIDGANPVLLELQTAYVDRLLHECAPMPNVIYCIENEGWGGAQWEAHWARHIRSQVPDALVTAMPHEPTDNTWTTYFDTGVYSCLDGGGTGLRTATRGEDQNHEDLEPRTERSRTDQFIQVRECMAKYSLYMRYEPTCTMPIYVSNAFGLNRDSLWAMLCCGAAGFRYHRNNWTENGEIYRWLEAFNRFLTDTSLPFADMTPRHDLLRGYGLLLQNREVFVAYVPSTGNVTYVPESGVQSVSLRYFDPKAGEWLTEESNTVAVGQDGGLREIVLKGRSVEGIVVYGQIESTL